MKQNATEVLYGTGSRGQKTIVEKVEVIKEVYTSLPRCHIGIVGLTAGAGATFVSLTLAKAISFGGVLPSVVQLWSDDIGETSGVNIGKDNTPVVIYDFSAGTDEQIVGKIQDMDQIIIVIDPLPSKIVKGFDLYEKIIAAWETVAPQKSRIFGDPAVLNEQRSSLGTVLNEDKEGRNVLIAINKCHNEIRIKDLEKIFSSPSYAVGDGSKLMTIRSINPKYIYTAEIKNIPPYSICFVRAELEKDIKKLLHHILPKEIQNVLK